MRQSQAKSVWLVRLIAFVIVLAVFAFAVRYWLVGALGVARLFSSAVSPEEGALPPPEDEAIPPMTFPADDSLYDAVYPELVEPSLYD